MRIAGGIVAHNDEDRIERSIRSLLDQELPTNTAWSRIWVVASGCTDGTVDRARAVERTDPRVSVLTERERRGKSAAVLEVLRRAEGSALVLLNSDAVAAPGAVTALLDRAGRCSPPFAIMGRPVAPAGDGDRWASTMEWMWELHHDFHREMLEDGHGTHLSDELLLLSLPALDCLEDGVINDGGYLAVWLRAHGGSCWYAPEARVSIEVAPSLGQHLRQRRRIHVGNAQIRSRLGRAPMTLGSGLRDRPLRTLAALRRSLARPGGLRSFVAITACEAAAQGLAAWDRLPPRRDHVRWSRITPLRSAAPAPPAWLAPRVASSSVVEERIQLLVDVAREFKTEISLARLTELLPAGGPGDAQGWADFLSHRPELAAAVAPASVSLDRSSARSVEHAERTARYWAKAGEVVAGPLRWLAPWIRCVGVTGSTAYGTPEADDDLDFFVIARSGALPWLLAATYASVRIWRVRRRDAEDPPLCFNYLVDERYAPREFGDASGLLFAREVLTARVLQGDPYYRGLLATVPQIGRELPRLYSERSADPGPTASEPPAVGARMLSALAYLPLAAFLQLLGLRRNARLRREHRDSAAFRTVTRPSLFAFQSRRFEELRDRYETPTRVPSPSVGGPSSTRMPWSR